jgi:GNAT superfamily N-acetyltransferase
LSSFAELLVHVRPERLEALKKLQAGIEGKLQQYMQVPPACATLLQPLHFYATQIVSLSASQPTSHRKPVETPQVAGGQSASNLLPNLPLLTASQQCMQAHGPLLHLHFMATLPDKQGSGLGRSLLEHLERMADAGWWVGGRAACRLVFHSGIGPPPGHCCCMFPPAQQSTVACLTPPAQSLVPCCPAPAEGKHLYLEASSTDSRRLYHQHGFK